MDLPLREVLITTNVPTLAGLTTLAGLGVADCFQLASNGLLVVWEH